MSIYQITVITLIITMLNSCSFKRNQFDLDTSSKKPLSTINPSTKKLLSYHISYPSLREQIAIDESFNKAMEYSFSGQTVIWRNGINDNHGHITPIKTFRKNDTFCRAFKLTSDIKEKRTEYDGIACRAKDGSWQLQ